MSIIKSISIFLFCFFCSVQVFAQGFNTDFGQNRVQYEEFIWSYVESENFVIYYYQGGQQLGKFTLLAAEESLPEIESKLEFKNNSKIEFMVYHDISDLKQTNIGLDTESINTGGVTKIIGNKVFIHFNGNYQEMERDIRQGIARVFLEKMVFGGNIQEVLQNAVLLNLPDWYINGLTAYIGEEWSTYKDDQLREAILNNRLKKFHRLTNEEATFAGHALWNYIALMHGPDAIPNLLYITRVNRSMESGFVFVLGRSLKNTIEEFNNYYNSLYSSELTNKVDPLEGELVFQSKKNMHKKRIIIDEVKVSPDGRYIAYTTNEIGKHKVILYDTEKNNRKTILKTGFRSFNNVPNEVYPLLAWDRKSQRLAVAYEKRSVIQLMTYDVAENKKETKPVYKFQQISDIAFTATNRRLVVSAVKNGQSDLFLYSISNAKVNRLTNDFYSDIQPRYIKLADRSGIIFASNRTQDTLITAKIDSILPTTNFDIFFYDLNKEEPELVKVTDTPLAQESLPRQYDKDHISFLSDQNGISNHYVAWFDSVYLRTDTKVFYNDSLAINPTYPLDTFQRMGIIDTIIKEDHYKIIAHTSPVSNYSRHILESDIALKDKANINLIYKDGRYRFIKESLENDPRGTSVKLQPTTYRKQMENFAKAEAKKPKQDSFNKIIDFKTTRSPKPAPTPPKPKEDLDIQIEMNDPDNKEEATEETGKEVSDANNKPKEDEIDIENYFFQSEFDYEEAEKEKKKTTAPKEATANNINTEENKTNTTLVDNYTKPVKKRSTSLFKKSKVRVYKPIFSIDQVVSQLDNTIIFSQYESFNFNGGAHNPPDLGGMLKVAITDLFEDYRLVGGVRPSINLTDFEYFLEYHALKKRIDKRILFYSKTLRNNYIVETPDFEPFNAEAKNISNYLQFSLHYPFDRNRSLRGHLGYRGDKIHFLAKDQASLSVPNQQENWFYTKLEYIFDNTLNVDLNILNGTRYKFYAEFQKPFEAVINDRQFNFNIKDTGLLGVLGGDFRHYQKVHRQIVWANRVASAFSFGSRKMVYFLGGVENWLVFDPTKRFNSDTPIDRSQNYAFQSLGTNLRGFSQNIRNGSSYVVINSEFRVPIIAYLSQSPIRSEFFRNFQVVAFADVGSAWLGLSPFNEENQYNIVQIDADGVVGPNEDPFGPVVATVRYFRNPIVAGYGFGARTKLLGYFLKLDMAWGLDSGARTDPRYYISMGLDF